MIEIKGAKPSCRSVEYHQMIMIMIILRLLLGAVTCIVIEEMRKGIYISEIE